MRNAAASDWRKQQQLNFIHHNHLHLKPVPRESREAFGYTGYEQPDSTASKVLTYIGCVILLVLVFSPYGWTA